MFLEAIPLKRLREAMIHKIKTDSGLSREWCEMVIEMHLSQDPDFLSGFKIEDLYYIADENKYFKEGE